ncbi:MAG: SDR family oxidoreductase [Pseudomonadota bacterium]
MTDNARKVALVTGGARGIGREIATTLANDYKVVITWNTTQPIGLPAGVRALQFDLTDEGSCAEVIDNVTTAEGRLDLIVNNAGVVAASPADTFDSGVYRHLLDVNLLVPHALLAAALPYLDPGANVISISSMNADLPPRDAVLYGASKAALNLWTRGMAKELGTRGIRVNAVAPGAINIPEEPRSNELTQAFVDLTALGRIGRPRDIASAVAFLASDAASFITGTVLTVSGGYRL